MTIKRFVNLHVGVSCGDPGDIDNGNKTGGYLFSDTVTYTCHDGYNMTSGNSKLVCEADGRWHGMKPHCSGLYIYIYLLLTLSEPPPSGKVKFSVHAC